MCNLWDVLDAFLILFLELWKKGENKSEIGERLRLLVVYKHISREIYDQLLCK